MNEEVLKLNEAVDHFANICGSLGYVNRSIEVLNNQIGKNFEEADRLITQTDRLEVTRDSIRDDQAEARKAIFDAFEHHYS